MPILLVLLFEADKIFAFAYDSADPLYEDELGVPTERLRAMTIVFQTYFFMQIFNMINSRRIDDYNVFENLTQSYALILVILLALGIQMLIIAFGGRLMRTYPLSIKDSGICFAIAASSLLWGIIFRLIPASWFKCLVREEQKK